MFQVFYNFIIHLWIIITVTTLIHTGFKVVVVATLSPSALEAGGLKNYSCILFMRIQSIFCCKHTLTWIGLISKHSTHDKLLKTLSLLIIHKTSSMNKAGLGWYFRSNLLNHFWFLTIVGIIMWIKRIHISPFHFPYMTEYMWINTFQIQLSF